MKNTNCLNCSGLLSGRQRNFCSQVCKDKCNNKNRRDNYLDGVAGMQYIMSNIKLGEFVLTLGISDNNIDFGDIKWYMGSQGYIQSDPKYGQIYLHRVIWTFFNGEIPDKMQIDHINRDKLDNRLSNLRCCTSAENNRNTSSRTGTSSKYKGVSLTEDNTYHAAIALNKITHSLGYFKTEKEAASVYNKAAVELHGEYACLNIIE